MPLHEKMETFPFSNSEKKVIAYMLEEKARIKKETIKEIAAKNYTAPSTLIRIAKKLNFSGWNDFRDAFLDEVSYLNEHFKDVDANFPFVEKDDFSSIASKLMHLNNEAVQDTNHLIDQNDLYQAVKLLEKSQEIYIFATSGNLLIAQDFQVKMSRIKKRVTICTTEGEQLFAASNLRKDACAIVISYSGETNSVIKLAEILYLNHVPIISITSIGESSLGKFADIKLRISTREKLYSKIANFAVNASICYLLDVLYGCFFSLDYQKNLNYKLMVADMVESNRTSTSDIIDEKRQRITDD
ncbi:MurR/RpiR family transcriptional regulator [Enterococcus hulanensis]|uniref:MurR/RpiR family transcriptional regulator n=1 Tax=Enterococcus hulanensis TaxID=2559929 RepID=UPI0010F5BFDD|nr:MurR/RpiR family transcriptional regulator [Enterococcus hulanensis]